MRLSKLGIAVIVTGSLTQPVGAAAPSKSAESPSVGAGFVPRAHRATSWGPIAGLTGWRAIWDNDTGVPLRLWGDSPTIRGSVADPAVAEAAARQFLATHLSTLAPGASAADFELVSNALSRNGDVRSIGFVQRMNGMRVLGGAIGFSFKHDRLALVSSTALPHVAVARPRQRMSSSNVADRAIEWMRAEGHRATTNVMAGFAPSEPVIVPIVRARTASGIDVSYRVAEQIVVDADAGPDSWDVWVDANDGSPILRRSRLHYANGTIKYLVPDRFPGNGRTAQPAAFATHSVNGTNVTALEDGTVTWAGTANASVSPGLKGPYAVLSNEAGELVSQTVSLPPNGSIVWDQSANEVADAQLSAFVAANYVKQFVRDNIAPNMAWLDQPLSVTVNEAGSCNAYNAPDGIHFLRRGACENTALLADVVYHEFGHALHRASIIEGVGQFDGAISEGLSDFLSALISKDHKMAPGWRMTEAPLRDINPIDSEMRWPEDANGEVHNDGEIVAGALWDTWKALEQTRGVEPAYQLMLDYYYAIIQRSTDLQSAYTEVLVADDDDGNLANGTPNACAISSAFDRHGLTDPSHSLKLEIERNELAFGVKSSIGPNAPCQRGVQSAVVEWKVRDGASGTVELADSGTARTGEIPFQPDGASIQYNVKVTLTDGEVRTFPNNKADPYYEIYVGTVKPLWCSDFEAGLGGMTVGAGWELGLPLGMTYDPKTAAGGSMAIGTDLSENGAYQSSATEFSETPELDLAGNTHVRLQITRWMTDEDRGYDQARILANDTEIWTNATSGGTGAAPISHMDREWVFR
ncbi:MAG: hypothetical protein AB7O24_18855, partial [Kofleriaceae bacterium]